MAKPKAPSPQEQYRARKAREEREKSALLPPGLFNHGNTCFMNSVLQGLIATQHLQLAVHFQPVPLPLPITSRRSPTTLPIGDQLIAILRTAWDIQNNHKRENISPRDLLAAVGKKYDQYLDFRQQDAHEFLCQLLDAIRVEEMDVIKQRSPPPKKKCKRSQTSRPHDPTTPQPAPRADDELSSFVDMLFGGRLASILVCQACKHVSHTYEDFTDLCLSMKPEDYVRERKRDKLKQFAKKIGTAFYVGTPHPRSSSVPATPTRDSTLHSPEPNDTQRRRSIDLADVVQPVDHKQDAGVQDDTAVQVLPSPAQESPSAPGTPSDTPHPIPVFPVPEPPQESSGDYVTLITPEKVNGKERKDKDESWTKISKRISVSVGLTKRQKSERKDKKGTPSTTPSKPAEEESPLHHPSSVSITPDMVNGLASPSTPHEKEPTSLGLVNEKLQAQLTNVKRSVMSTQRSGNSPSGSSAPRFPLISRPASPGIHSKTSKRHRVPKPTTEEAAYLRDILADINPPNVPKPFSIFKQSKEPGSTSAFNAQNIFLRVNRINRIEECLRLFTSVEVLDGENTVRCHRCWKIANGFYQPRAKESAQDPDSCTESEDDEAVDAKTNSHRVAPNSLSANPTISIPSSSDPASPLRSTTSLQYTQISHDTLSALTQPPTRSSSTPKHIPPALQLNDGYTIELVSPISEALTPGILAVPSISTTTPESPMSVQTAKPAPASTLTQTSDTIEHSSGISLSAPPDQHRQHVSRSGDSNTESEISEAESETLLSVYSDFSSAASSNASPSASQDQLQQPSPTRSKDKRHPSGVPRSRQYLLRPAYKRYLIATPPPILIVHLKRFQQLSKAPVVSFSTGFKKLDDYISFPEYLDLAPYLAPRREDYFDSKVAVTRGRARRPAPCMYRLYAIVVHIGNMLGGHYVAYTALPPSPLPDTDGLRPESEKPRSANGTAPRDWAFISDTIVRMSSLEEVLKSKAYICMYERI
ncbi:peptidase C19, ubiquitin carboxyl-terminal hydrolase 2 [Boletus reticuloceps]|uniref:Ubiquitin carboxyl-terminal hydrolase n=1 Tax=Boletus reticuloceps TaxID=495285 RepID=A0A8I2YXS3_9AGAM|nr:peptidase C19, ubiquitin carboxyl-terminal hydrolase 2 [Boletus reticuloceps]